MGVVSVIEWAWSQSLSVWSQSLSVVSVIEWVWSHSSSGCGLSGINTIHSVMKYHSMRYMYAAFSLPSALALAVWAEIPASIPYSGLFSWGANFRYFRG